MIDEIPLLAAGTAVIGLAIAALLYSQIEKIKIENTTVADITQQIREGAMAFLFAEYRYLAIFIVIVAGLLFINPDFIEPYIEIALIYQLKNDTLTTTFYNNALKLDSTNIIVLYNLALYYQNNLNYNMALETYNKLLKYDSFNSNTHYNIGFIHMELDLHNIAVHNFADAIYSNSVFYEAYYARGICFETLGNIAQAEVDYKRSIEINPDYKFAIDALENLRNNNKKYN